MLILENNFIQRVDIRGAFNRFPDFFIQTFEIIVDSWKSNFYDFWFKSTATAGIWNTLY